MVEIALPGSARTSPRPHGTEAVVRSIEALRAERWATVDSRLMSKHNRGLLRSFLATEPQVAIGFKDDGKGRFLAALDSLPSGTRCALLVGPRVDKAQVGAHASPARVLMRGPGFA